MDTPVEQRRFLWRTLVLTMAIGVALGLGSEWAGYLPYPWYFVAILGGPWVAATFLVARLARWLATQIASAIAVPVIGLAVNTIYKRVAYGSGSVQLMTSEWPRWALLAVLGGIVIGVAAPVSRGRDPVKAAVGWGILVGIILAEAVAITIGTHGASVRVAVVDVIVVVGLSFMAVLHVRPFVFLGTAVIVTVSLAALLPVVREAFPVF